MRVIDQFRSRRVGFRRPRCACLQCRPGRAVPGRLPPGEIADIGDYQAVLRALRGDRRPLPPPCFSGM
jgi:hypothetical protein